MKIKQKRLVWEAPADTDVVGYDVYSAEESDALFLSEVDAGLRAPIANNVAGTVFVIPAADFPEGRYQFATVTVDDAGNESDPYQPEAWRSLPLDLVAPGPARNGSVESF